MDVLQKKLHSELSGQPDTKVIKSEMWGLPIQLVRLSFTTVKRAKMDVLMKMILMSIRRLEISSSEDIASFLHIEPLFAKSVMSRLQSSALIRMENGAYMLTDAGAERLESGIFEHLPETEERDFYYSPCHHALFLKDDTPETAEALAVYRWKEQSARKAEELEESQLLEALQEAEMEASEDSMQMVITEIDLPLHLEDLEVPCIEFLVARQSDGSRYTRVWNTLLDQWDEALEKQIEEHGRLET